MTTFEELGLTASRLAAVKQLGYEEPTPVQEQAIPLVLDGRDIVATAQTGTGKTAAFGLPILQRVKPNRKQKAPAALVVTPTRELAEQIEHFFTTSAQATRHRILTVFGGVAYARQLRKLRDGVDVCVATPGRLIDLMERGACDLSHVAVLVLDEADRMLDMGFWPDVEKIIAATPAEGRQTMLFSATIDRQVADTVKNSLKDPAFVEIAHRGDTAETIEQHVIRIPHRKKPELLRCVLERRGCMRTIVFVRTKGACDDVARDLRQKGFRAEPIHSNLSQAKRRQALQRFKEDRIGVLVATDVLARGIDVSDVEHIINYDLPDVPDDYIHRIGRTGRAGKSGDALSFVSPKGERNLKSIERLIGEKIPVLTLDDILSLPVLEQPQYNDAPEERPRDKHRGGSRSGADRQHARRTAKKAAPGERKAGGHGKKPLHPEHPAERRIREKEAKTAKAARRAKNRAKDGAAGSKKGGAKGTGARGTFGGSGRSDARSFSTPSATAALDGGMADALAQKAVKKAKAHGAHKPGGVAAFGEAKLNRKRRG